MHKLKTHVHTRNISLVRSGTASFLLVVYRCEQWQLDGWDYLIPVSLSFQAISASCHRYLVGMRRVKRYRQFLHLMLKVGIRAWDHL